MLLANEELENKPGASNPPRAGELREPQPGYPAPSGHFRLAQPAGGQEEDFASGFGKAEGARGWGGEGSSENRK